MQILYENKGILDPQDLSSFSKFIKNTKKKIVRLKNKKKISKNVSVSKLFLTWSVLKINFSSIKLLSPEIFCSL